MNALIRGAVLLAACVVAPLARAEDQPVQSMRIDLDAIRPLDNRCRYHVAVHGVIVPSRSQEAAKGKGEPVVEPQIDVAAEVLCPTSSTIRIVDTAMSTGPLTRTELVAALERRATVLDASKSKRCLYVPDLSLDGEKLSLTSVATSCETVPKK